MVALVRRIPPGAPVALLALGAYLWLTATMPAGIARTGLGALLPMLGLACAVTVAILRLPRAGADREATRRMFEMAGAFTMASPVLALALHLAG